MKKFRDISLRRKQMQIIMVTSMVSLVLACSAFVANDVATFRREMVASTSSLAEVVGLNMTAAIDFNDPYAAADALASLRGEPSIIHARVITPDGETFATYGSDEDHGEEVLESSLDPQTLFAESHLHLLRPIAQAGEPIGAIELVADLGKLRDRLWRYANIASLVLGTSLLAAFWLSSQLQKLISDPILKLAKMARSVAVDRDYSIRATQRSNDEIGQLVRGFNEMLDQIQARESALQKARDTLEERVRERTLELEKTHRQLLEASRRGGMAEIATNVLHNVGNVLNSVNVSVDLIACGFKRSKASLLGRVVELLKSREADLADFIANDPKGRQLPSYLEHLAQQLADEKATAAAELESLRGNVDHIKEIVSMQQSYAMVGGVKEKVSVVKLVEDSIRMNEGALNRHLVEVERDYQEVPPVNVDKHKVLQILVNLVRNAKYACDESYETGKRMIVRVANGGGKVKISVIDNGVGIAPENLTRIFNYGFTTRANGHGFGLHSGALAAKEMDGSLTVRSDGPGKGATFTLELPCAEEPGPN